MVKTFNPQKRPEPDHETESIRVWIEDPDNPLFDKDSVKQHTITYKGAKVQILNFNALVKNIDGKDYRLFYYKLRFDKKDIIYFIDEEKLAELPEQNKLEYKQKIEEVLNEINTVASVVGLSMTDMKDSLEVTLSELPTLENLSKMKKKKDLNTEGSDKEKTEEERQ